MSPCAALPSCPATRLALQLVVLMLAAGWCLDGLAQQADAAAKPAKPDKLFASEDTLDITLHLPWRKLVRDVENQQAYPAVIEFTDSLGQPNRIELSAERRGLTRQRVCKYPPIKLRFDKQSVKGTMLRGQKSIKMVTHCDKGDRYEQYYIKEMLAYRMYNLVTERSFKVRPLAVSYVDSGSGSRQDPRFGFLIEDDSDVAKRNGLERLDLAEIEPEQLESSEASLFALFQYLIANVDWSALGGPDENKCCHNAKLMGTETDGNVFAIPYDFDSSGLVDAHYAAPNEHLPINNVTQRLYRGFCVHNPSLAAARQKYLDLEPQIYALVEQEPRLSTRSRKNMTRYLGEFFHVLRDESKYQKFIIGKCRK